MAKPEVPRGFFDCSTGSGLSAECPWGPDAFLEAARADKKSTGGSVTLVLPLRLGRLPARIDPLRDFRKLLEIGIPTDAPQSC